MSDLTYKTINNVFRLPSLEMQKRCQVWTPRGSYCYYMGHSCNFKDNFSGLLTRCATCLKIDLKIITERHRNTSTIAFYLFFTFQRNANGGGGYFSYPMWFAQYCKHYDVIDGACKQQVLILPITWWLRSRSLSTQHTQGRSDQGW